MKLKKMLSVIVAGGLSLATFTGCTQSNLSYYNNYSKVAQWKETTGELTGTVTFNLGETQDEINISCNAKQKDKDVYIEYEFSDKAKMIPEPVKMNLYIHKNSVYVNKGFYEQISTISGEEVPKKLKELDADYIAIDSGLNSEADLAKIQSTFEPAKFMENYSTVFGNYNVELPYKNDGNEYVLEMNSDEIIDLGVKAYKAISANLPKINEKYQLKLTEEDMNSFKAPLQDAEFIKGIDKVKEGLDGSSFKSKVKFEDDMYKSDMNLDLKIKDAGSINLKFNSTITKENDLELNIPTKVVKMTQEEFSGLFGEEASEINDSALAKIKEVI